MMKVTTLNEAIDYFDSQCANQYSREEKIRWLSEIDERIYNEIILKRLPLVQTIKIITANDVANPTEIWLTLFDYNKYLDSEGTQFTTAQINTVFTITPGTEDVGKTFGNLEFNGYDDDTNGDTVLLVPAMYKDLYRYWIEKNVDINNREIGAANNAMAMFQTYYDDYYAWVNTNYRVTASKRISIY